MKFKLLLNLSAFFSPLARQPKSKRIMTNSIMVIL